MPRKLVRGERKRNTLDLDFNNTERISRIVCKVLNCSVGGNLSKFEFSPSMNGIHLEFWCRRNCDLCRFVFDDPFRYAADLTRPVYTRDVLWERKSFFKMNCTIVLEK